MTVNATGAPAEKRRKLMCASLKPLLTMDGVTRSLAEWGALRGIDPHNIRTRLQRGWDPAEAVTSPIGGVGYFLVAGDEVEDRRRERERINRNSQRWRELHPERTREINQRSAAKNKHRRKFIKLKSIRGITEAEYRAMLDQQGGLCAICRREPDRRGLCVDHCHRTDRVRRLLCQNCNSGLGHFRDDPQALENAAQYVRSFTVAS